MLTLILGKNTIRGTASVTSYRSNLSRCQRFHFIYSVERIEPYRTLLEPMWQAAQANQFEIVSSELVLLETLVKPLRESDVILERLFRSLFEAQEVRLLPATTAIWEQAARLRAKTSLKTPDALHAATALATGCTLLVTNDAAFRQVPDLSVIVLKDFIETA